MSLEIACQAILNRLPEFLVNDGRMLSREDLVLVGDTSVIDRIAQNAIEMAPAEGASADRSLRLRRIRIFELGLALRFLAAQVRRLGTLVRHRTELILRREAAVHLPGGS